MSDVDRLLYDDRTSPEIVPTARIERPTRTSYDWVAVSAVIRDKARFLADDASDFHEQQTAADLESRAHDEARRSAREMLDDLAALGFAWRDIARLVGVTVPAVRKWRNGEPIAGPNRWALARLLAFVKTLRSDHLIDEVASWMEMPIAGSTLTGIDVYGMGHVLPLLLHGTDHLKVDQLLLRVDPLGEHRPDDRFEVVTAPDGLPAVRMRSETPPG